MSHHLSFLFLNRGWNSVPSRNAFCVVSECLAFVVMTLPTLCVSVVRGGKGESVIELERGGWHKPLVVWLNTNGVDVKWHYLRGVDVFVEEYSGIDTSLIHCLPRQSIENCFGVHFMAPASLSSWSLPFLFLVVPKASIPWSRDMTVFIHYYCLCDNVWSVRDAG